MVAVVFFHATYTVNYLNSLSNLYAALRGGESDCPFLPLGPDAMKLAYVVSLYICILYILHDGDVRLFVLGLLNEILDIVKDSL